ncbi:MAG: hypothetical protein GAK29_01460 [Acinetobacter bereziniae]|uniref:Phage holin, lambda family n=1 Tax=Acinetobacter bereziniae TaxID=106648 RepID=A0A833TZH6_ACIBZ|nr:MAG: hypothetical protein GAK29_01460 [Acinetobacter bereziniae]
MDNLDEYAIKLFKAVNFGIEHGYTVMGIIAAFLVAFWRTSQQKGKGDWLEAGICSTFTLSLSVLLEWMKLPIQLSILIGSFVGYIGAAKISKIISKKVGLEDDEK